MSRKKEIRATTRDVKNRLAARLWLTEAILRAQRDGIDCAPIIPLLEALENLDAIEVVENLGEESEQVVASSMVGPAGTWLKAGQVMRLTGKTARILTMPETSSTIVNGPTGGRRRTPAENERIAFGCAAIMRLKQLGLKHGMAVSLVENDFGPIESDLKKIRSGKASAPLIPIYEDKLAELALLDGSLLLYQIGRMADFFGK